MSDLSIIGIRIDERSDHASSVQKVLTDYGNSIVGRFGVPAPNKQNGLVAVVVEADDREVQNLTSDLLSIDGVLVNSMNL